MIKLQSNKFPPSLERQVRRVMSRRVRPHRILSGPLRGRSLVTSWHDYPAAILGYSERPLLEWLGTIVKPGQTWIDVGAHYGYVALALSGLVGASGRVFAFEPVLPTAGCLNRTRFLNSLPQLSVIPLALGASDKLQLVEAPVVRGMADHAADVHTHITERIMAVAFDAVWPGFAGAEPHIHGIKVDVQGMEIDVLSGMHQVLTALHPTLVIELHSGVDRPTIVQLLSGMGYRRRGQAISQEASHGEVEYEDNCSYCFVAT